MEYVKSGKSISIYQSKEWDKVLEEKCPQSQS